MPAVSHSALAQDGLLRSYGNDNLYTGKQSVESRVIMMELDGKSRPPALHFQCYKVADLLSSLDLQ